MMTQPARTPRLSPLHGYPLSAARSTAAGYAHRLLASLGASTPDIAIDPIAAQALWARSGAMALTGRADGPPLACPAPLAACLQGAVDALQTLAPRPFTLDAAPLLGERAAIAGHHRQGPVSPGGSCRLLQARDGFVALNLARDDDWSLLPALLDGAAANDWPGVAAALRRHSVATLGDKAQLLGLALSAAAGEPCARHWYEIVAVGPQRQPRRPAPLVIDLSSLWAGPLCGHLLQQAGARVIKVESTSRPDGARRGPTAFFDLLNAGKHSVALDLHTSTGIAQLRALLQAADIVIESSRPRALQQLGIDAEALVRTQPGLTWLSITGYGRAQALRIAYGDDAGVAAGLSALLQRHYGEPLICGDAIADPLTGAYAALAALAGWHGGGGYLLDVALHAVINHCIEAGTVPCGTVASRSHPVNPLRSVRGVEPSAVEPNETDWLLRLQQQTFAVLPPRARVVTAPAPALGADNANLLREFGLPC